MKQNLKKLLAFSLAICSLFSFSAHQVKANDLRVCGVCLKDQIIHYLEFPSSWRNCAYAKEYMKNLSFANPVIPGGVYMHFYNETDVFFPSDGLLSLLVKVLNSSRYEIVWIFLKKSHLKKFNGGVFNDAICNQALGSLQILLKCIKPHWVCYLLPYDGSYASKEYVVIKVDMVPTETIRAQPAPPVVAAQAITHSRIPILKPKAITSGEVESFECLMPEIQTPVVAKPADASSSVETHAETSLISRDMSSAFVAFKGTEASEANDSVLQPESTPTYRYAHGEEDDKLTSSTDMN